MMFLPFLSYTSIEKINAEKIEAFCEVKKRLTEKILACIFLLSFALRCAIQWVRK